MDRHRPSTAPARLAIAVVLALCSLGSQAALFEDDEARRAVLDLRQRVDALRQSAETSSQRLGDDNAQMRRSLLDLQNQIEALRAEQATLRGQNEQLQRDVTELQRRQRDMAKGVDERLRQFEPVPVSVDGLEFSADPAAQAAFSGFDKRYPKSGYAPSVLFWLGNAQYAQRDYKEAISNFKQLLSVAPNHMRAPEAALSIANCQGELKDAKAARKTLEDLIKVYPQSEAAAAAKERLARMK
jgi:tol-pal system protein YbgF